MKKYTGEASCWSCLSKKESRCDKNKREGVFENNNEAKKKNRIGRGGKDGDGALLGRRSRRRRCRRRAEEGGAREQEGCRRCTVCTVGVYEVKAMAGSPEVLSKVGGLCCCCLVCLIACWMVQGVVGVIQNGG